MQMEHRYGRVRLCRVRAPAWPERDVVLLEVSSRLSDAEQSDFYEVLKARGYVRVPGIGLAAVDSHRFARPIRVPQ